MKAKALKKLNEATLWTCRALYVRRRQIRSPVIHQLPGSSSGSGSDNDRSRGRGSDSGSAAACEKVERLQRKNADRIRGNCFGWEERRTSLRANTQRQWESKNKREAGGGQLQSAVECNCEAQRGSNNNSSIGGWWVRAAIIVIEAAVVVNR